MTATELLSRLDGVAKTSSGWAAKCPAHEDGRASLSIGTGTDGKILLKCFAGCDTRSICGALSIDIKDLFAESRNGHAEVKRKIVCSYPYTDESGKLLFEVVRFIPKDFSQRRPDPSAFDGWAWNTKGVRKVLYRLPEVITAVKRGLPILLCEGEKDVATLVERGFCATTNPGGSSKWLPEFSETLRGANVYLIPDNDESGGKHSKLVAEKLREVAKLRIVELPAAVNGRKVKDPADYFAAGGTAENFQQLLDESEIPTAIRALNARKFNPANRPGPLRDVFALGEVPISTPGNITTITAQAKTGKSAFVGGLLAATLARGNADTFGIRGANPDGKAVLHFDTEQSPEDHWHLIDRALRRSGALQVPEWLMSYCLTGWPAAKCWEAVQEATKDAAQRSGGVHSIHIDGVADLVCDVNDPEECNRFVAELHALAIGFDCPVIGVLHFNPGTEKSRGHLGSQLERKSETNLRLDKDGETTAVWSEKQRRAPILKGSGPCFKWDDSAGMHVSCSSINDAKDHHKVEQYQMQIDDVFSNRPAMRYSEIISTLKERLKLSQSTSERRVSEYLRLGLLKKSVANLYSKSF